MPNFEDYLSDLGLGGGQSKKSKPMWGEVIPDMSKMQGEKGTGIAGIIGKLAQIGGTVANFIPGGQAVGVPLTMAGSTLEGADKEGLSGALKYGAMSGVKAAASAGMGSLVEGLKSPVDTGQMTAYSSTGNPLSVPGIRNNPMEVFSSQGSPMTVPASPKEWAGGS